MTPGLREARLIEYVGNEPAYGQAFVQAMLEAGLVVREVSQPSGQADALVIAHGLSGQSLDIHSDAVVTLSLQARKLEERGGTLVLLQDTGGAFQPHDHRAWRGGLSGLGRTAAREFPKATVRVVDIDVAGLGLKPAANTLLEELMTGGGAPCVGLSEAGRLVPSDTFIAFPENRPGLIGPQDTILVTGGARGVTADCIIELADRTRARFALLGRSPITPWPDDLEQTGDERALRGALAVRAKSRGEKRSPADINRQAQALLSGAEIRATLAAIEAAGGEVLYVPADVSDPVALKGAIGQVTDQFGPVTGLVHGAGVLADKLIREKTRDQIERVFAPKIGGLEALLSVLDASQLKAIAFFSSVAARYGNAGQSDYAMANEILNRMAHWLKAANPQAAVTSLGWGPWDGGMVDETLKAKFAEMGVSLIPRDAGARLFVDAVLAGAACPVELVIGSDIAHG